jgi:clan AA aspartic protease
MGIVYADLRISNFARPDLEEITVDAVADTGAIELVIPEHLAIQLQLEELNPRELRLADGTRKVVRYAAPVKVQMMGRDCVTSAIVTGDVVLLGAVPMELMDLVVDPRTQRVMPNPENPNVPGLVVYRASRAAAVNALATSLSATSSRTTA